MVTASSTALPCMVPSSPSRSVASTPRNGSSSSSSKRTRKTCTSTGCTKVDAGGGHCVAHGGGKKCQYPGCHKGYQTGGFCRAHGGGARCQMDGCGKVDAGKGLCRAHGGGKRCQKQGCTKADVGGGFCTAHGGGKRCSEPGCTKIDQGGGRCRAHGGARRCNTQDCDQPARGATGLCSAHGGAPLCAVPNCRRLVKTAGQLLCSACVSERIKTEDEMEDVEYHQAIGYDNTTMPPFSSLLVDATRFIESPEQNSFDDGLQMPMVLDESVALALDETQTSGQEEQLNVKLSSCLDNGCSKSFGGRCNCKEGCTCCTRARLAEQRERIGGPQGATDQVIIPPSSSAGTVLATPEGATPSYLPLIRIVLSISFADVPVELLRAVIKGVPAVRSVHLIQSPSQEENDDSAVSHRFVVRGDPGFRIACLEVLSTIGVSYTVEEESAINWSQKEVVLKVPDMMCPGNCGRTVLNALLQVNLVHRANLAFDERSVVAFGDMSTTDLCDAVDATGFALTVTSETPLPMRFKFRVHDLVSVHLLGDRLYQLMLDVEGVETVVLVVERAEMLVVATLVNAASLLRVANAHRIIMVEIPEEAETSPFEPTQPDRPASSSSSSSASTDSTDHICDVSVCPMNGCEQYRATVAHTAALAVGWSVPGCAMSWGGECTCGENCKCAGCPEHNPSS